MRQYLVIKSVQLLIDRKTFRKDMIMTAEDAGEDKIKRYLARGYIKPIGTNIAPEPENNGDDKVIDFLVPKEVAKLPRKELRAYARKLGLSFANSIADDTLAGRINEYIAESSDGDADDDDEGFLMPEEVAKLPRQELSAYAKEIGVSFADDVTDADLVTLVKEFIEKELQESGR